LNEAAAKPVFVILDARFGQRRRMLWASQLASDAIAAVRASERKVL